MSSENDVKISLYVVRSGKRYEKEMLFYQDMLPLSGDYIRCQSGWKTVVVQVKSRIWKNRFPDLNCAVHFSVKAADLIEVGFSESSDTTSETSPCGGKCHPKNAFGY
jgi:hypothetical protein